MTELDPVLDRLRIRMKAEPRSQRDVARALGCTEKHLSRVLRHGDGSFAFIVRLAAELGLTITAVRATTPPPAAPSTRHPNTFPPAA